MFLLTERPSLYLASKSPRRQELLRQIGVEFEELKLREGTGRRRDVLETPRKDESPLDAGLNLHIQLLNIGSQDGDPPGSEALDTLPYRIIRAHHRALARGRDV